eukprot:4355856-Lingulodinium_polyedra.AAC.1
MLRAFSAKYPGALTARFLAAVRQRVRGAGGAISQTRELRDVSLAEFMSGGHTGLSELRDTREAMT